LTARERIACEALQPIGEILEGPDSHHDLLVERVLGGQIAWIFLGQVNKNYKRKVKILINDR
jgi:hypothetical protein